MKVLRLATLLSLLCLMLLALARPQFNNLLTADDPSAS